MRGFRICRRRCAAGLVVVAACILPATKAGAVLTLMLQGEAASSIVDATFSGSATATAAKTVFNQGWEFLPTSYDPFPQSISDVGRGAYHFLTGSAEIRNASRDAAYEISGIWMQDSLQNPTGHEVERFGILHGGPFRCSAGEIIEWSGSATIDLAPAGLIFSDLRPGSSGPVFGVGSFSTQEYPGQLVIVGVPEPSGWCLFAIVCCLRGRSRRRG